MFGLKKKPAIAEPEYYLERSSYFQGRLDISGWAFHAEKKIKKIVFVKTTGEKINIQGFPQASDDIVAAHGNRAESCRFSSILPDIDKDSALRFSLLFIMESGEEVLVENPRRKTRINASTVLLFDRFKEELKQHNQGKVLEIGSRNRSGNVRKEICPEGMEYVGVDILEGDNVDIVADAHKLSDVIPKNSIDAIFSISTFEHLLMPWKAAIEINKILKLNGVVCILTHQTWPVHEEPWDYFRFSEYAWRGLFNEHTGFEIIDATMAVKARVVPEYTDPIIIDIPNHNASFLSSVVYAKKIGDTKLSWDVDVSDVTADVYPE